VKLELSYIFMLVGCEKQLTISDDENLYFASIDNENPRCLLFVEAAQATRGKSSFRMNHKELQPNNDEIGPNAITLYIEHELANQQNEV
ncbi:hypothetical protein ABTO24_19910, partial [Acinetobacter baumannii]